MQPLAGITVVSLEQAVAAPMASRHLADLGARVIKVERPGAGDFARGYDKTVNGLSSHFVWLNRSKESLTLDLKSALGREVMKALLARADVFIQNLAPGAIDRLGLDDTSLRTAYPRLIVCHISGYGRDGPYRDKKAYDLLVQAEAGLLAVTGTEETPSKTGISAADIAAGMYAYSGILTALLARHQTGAGTVLEVSLLDALAEWMGYPLYYTAYGGQAPARTGASHATIAPYGPYACGDGQSVMLGIQNEREWRRFCAKVLSNPGLTTDPRFVDNAARSAHVSALKTEIDEVFAGLDRAAVMQRLDDAQIACSSLNSVDQMWCHSQLSARDRWREIDSSAGRLKALLPPVIDSTIDYRMDPIPEPGAQSESILAELGYDECAITRLRVDEVI